MSLLGLALVLGVVVEWRETRIRIFAVLVCYDSVVCAVW